MSSQKVPESYGPLDTNAAYGVRQARHYLGGISHSFIYAKITAGDLKTYKDGKRRLIPGAEIKRYIDAQAAGAQS